MTINPDETTHGVKGSCQWQSPSNIALVKYWGKRHEQIPCNPSISFTLDNAYTKTILKWKKKDDSSSRTIDFSFDFHGSPNEKFSKRIHRYLERLSLKMPVLKDYHLTISSGNTFPHSSGIASSASAMSALAACLVDMAHQIYDPHEVESGSGELLNRRISRLSRLGSGSACRSVYPMAALWGACDFPESDDQYAVGLESILHQQFHGYRDAILLVDQGAKKVSSSAGHQLMDHHPYAEVRYENARQNCHRLLAILKSGNLEDFIPLVESEALTLHALMMASSPGYILLNPHTLEVINRIIEYRAETGVPLCFTLDAGPNVHLLYPENYLDPVREFIKTELLPFCVDRQWLDDRMGLGIQKLS